MQSSGRRKVRLECKKLAFPGIRRHCYGAPRCAYLCLSQQKPSNSVVALSKFVLNSVLQRLYGIDDNR